MARSWIGAAAVVLWLGQVWCAAWADQTWLTPFGDPDLTNPEIAFDPSGALWIGTETGLYRHDGRRAVPVGAADLPHEVVQALKVDERGGVWVGTRLGLAYEAPEGGMRVWSPASPARARREPYHLPGGFVLSVLPAPGGAWVGLDGHGLVRVSDQTGTVVFPDAPLLDGATIHDIVRGADGVLWLATAGQGVLRYDPDADQATMIDPPGTVIRNVLRLAVAPDGRLWLLGWDDEVASSLILYDPATNEAETFPSTKRLGYARAVLPDGEDAVIVGYNGGVARFERTESGELVPQRLTLPTGHAYLRRMTRAPDGTVWFGFDQGGLAVAATPLPGVSVFPVSKKKAFTSVAVWDDGVWATDNRLLRFENDALVSVDLPSALSESRLAKLAAGRDGLWLGFSSGEIALRRIDGAVDVIFEPGGKPDSWGEPHDLFQATDGSVWFVTHEGLFRGDPTMGTVRRYLDDPATSDGLIGIHLAGAAEGADGRIWIASLRGVGVLDPETDAVRTFRHDPDDVGTLASDEVTDVLPSGGAVWAASATGLNHIDARTHAVTRIGADDVIGTRQLTVLTEDARGHLWAGVRDALFRFDPETGRVTAFDREDVGLTSFHQLAATVDPRGRVWFAGRGGLMAVPSDAEPSEAPVTARVSSVLIDGEPTEVGSLRLGPDASSLRFLLTDDWFSGERASAFRFRLAGLETAWIETTADGPEARYSRLPPGRYVFEAAARSGAGVWSAPVTLPVRVVPPWYRTPVFSASVAAALIGLGWLAYRARVRRVTERVTQRQEAAFEERTRLAREMHDTLLQDVAALSLVTKGAARTLERRPEEAKQALTEAATQASTTARRARELILEMRSPSIPDLGEVALQELATTEAAGEPPRVRVSGGELITAHLGAASLGRLVEEAVRNVARHADATTVDVEAVRGKLGLVITIADDGRGFDTGAVTPRRLGLKGMKERVEELGGTFDLASSSEGTVVRVVVPRREARGRWGAFAKGKRTPRPAGLEDADGGSPVSAR